MTDEVAVETREQLLTKRSELIAQARVLLERGDTDAARDVLRGLEFATVDRHTLELTDGWLRQLAGDRRIVATCDPARTPSDDEVVIIYGNYPHVFDNVVVNNPIRRHMADYWGLEHDVVEADERWSGIDRIFVINMDSRLDRFDTVLRELALARAPLDRIHRISASTPEPHETGPVGGHLACLRSHIEAVGLAAQGPGGNVLVLEDDFTFTSDLDAHLTDLSAFVERDYDYWVCLVATSKYGSMVPKDDLVSMSFQVCTTTGGYLLSREGALKVLPVYQQAHERLKEDGDANTHAADRCWAVLQPSGKFLVFRRKWGFQAASFSNIEAKISRYLD